jgi:Flp pilus assembly protein TadG
MAALKRLWRSETGAELVEFAMTAPLMLVLIGGITDFARLFQSYEVVTNATREGARLASLPGYAFNDYAAVRNRIAQYITAGGATGTHTTVVGVEPISLGGEAVASGVRVTVTYTHGFWFIAPLYALLSGTFETTLAYSTTSIMRTEVQVPVPTPGGGAP